MSRSYRIVKCWFEKTNPITGKVTKTSPYYEIQYMSFWTMIWSLGNPWKKLYDEIYMKCNCYTTPDAALRALRIYIEDTQSSVEYKEETVAEYPENK